MPPRKQYVNLKPDVAETLGPNAALVPAERAGTSVHLKATVNPAVAGVKVRFQRRPTANNLAATGCFGRTIGVKKKSATTNAQGEATVDFDVSKYGGDVFTFEAYTKAEDVKHVEPISGEAGNADGSVEYEVWRRIYYQKSRLDAGPRGAGRNGNLDAVADLDLADFVAGLDGGDRRIRVELVDDTEPGNEVTARTLGGKSMNVIEDYDDYVRAAQAGYLRRRDGLSVRITLAHQLADSAVREGGFVFYEWRRIGDQPDRLEFPDPLWEDEAMALHRDWCVEAKWSWPGQAEVDVPVEIFTRRGAREIQLDISKVPGGQPQPTREDLKSAQFRIAIRWRCLTSSAGGGRLRGTNIILLATSFMGGDPPSAADLRSTLAHELGHALGMVPSSQGSHYTERGHQGPHCSSGGDWQGPLMGGWVRNGTCTMFGQNTDPPRAGFCDLCAEALRRKKIKLDSMPP